MRGSLAASAPLLVAVDEPPSALDPRGPAAERIADLSWILFGSLAAVCVVVVGLLVWALLRARRSRRDGAAVGGPGMRLVVGGGIVVPAVVLVAFMVLTVDTTAEVAAVPDGEPEIRVVGHQFWWEVRYPDARAVTANEVHVPVGRRVRLELTSADVIHSFWVPQLHGKADLVPGNTTLFDIEASEPGVYRGQCAEFCGIQHALMAMLVVAHPEEEYLAWLAREAEPAAEPDRDTEARGRAVFMEAGCAACHTIRGTDADGDVGPDLTHLASRRTLAAGTMPNTRGHLAGWIADPQSAKPGNRMPPTTLPPGDLLSLLDYLQSLE